MTSSPTSIVTLRDAVVLVGGFPLLSGVDLDLDAALRVWEEAMALPETDPRLTPRWYHGDLLAENLLTP